MTRERDTQPVQLFPVSVRGSASHGSNETEGTSMRIDDEGMTVDGVDDVELGRFVWCDIKLPDGPVRALGEIMRRDPLELAMEVRFKHLFPDARRRLLTSLA
jgi:hypothetical protein